MMKSSYRSEIIKSQDDFNEIFRFPTRKAMQLFYFVRTPWFAIQRNRIASRHALPKAQTTNTYPTAKHANTSNKALTIAKKVSVPVFFFDYLW